MNIKPLSDRFATFARLVVDGHLTRVVILWNDGSRAVVRPVHEFNRVIACSHSDLKELT